MEISISVVFLVIRAREATEYKNVAEETNTAAGSKKTRREGWRGLSRSLGGREPGKEKPERVRSLLSSPSSLSLGRSHTETAGDCRVAINAVELTPGCPFAGKVRLKERRNGRQLPRSERTRGRRSARACL